MTADSELDFDDAPMNENEELDFDEEEGGEEESGQGQSPLRIILLVLLILVLLCVLCFLAGRFLPIPGIPGFPGEPTVPPPVDTPTSELPTVVITEQPPEEPTPTEEGEVPGPEEPTPTEAGEVPGPEEPTPTGEGEQPGPEEPTPTEEGEMPGPEEPTPTGEGQPPATQEPGEEPTATTEPVPGPTSTPAPGEPGQPNCDANIPPVADAGDTYEAMMGKGQAVVNFDGSGSIDPDGTIESYEWDFGDNSTPGSGQMVSHLYGSTGSFVARLTVTDDCGATSEDTADVTIVGPTPPANGTTTPTPASPPPSNPPPADATLGFCHLVQPGQTLSGLAAAYGVPWPALAEVNGVGLGYFVIAGQGLFIPTSELRSGPNVYEVQPGDTLGSVAGQCGLTANILTRVNNLDPSAGLSPGQILVIPLWRQVYP